MSALKVVGALGVDVDTNLTEIRSRFTKVGLAESLKRESISPHDLASCFPPRSCTLLLVARVGKIGNCTREISKLVHV